MSMSISGVSHAFDPIQTDAAAAPPAQTVGADRLVEALQPGYDMTQNSLHSLLSGIDRGRLNMSEGEKAALQMHVSQFGALITLAMNVSLGIGKACEKLQQG